MQKIIQGAFDVTSYPQPVDEVLQNMNGMRMIFKKQFHGPLTGNSTVTMMGVMNNSLASGGYVALEHIVATIDNRHGSFFMQHSSIMNKGVPTQTILVIPDTGTGQLVGITGSMIIEIIDKQHYYKFDYSLPG